MTGAALELEMCDQKRADCQSLVKEGAGKGEVVRTSDRRTASIVNVTSLMLKGNREGINAKL